MNRLFKKKEAQDALKKVVQVSEQIRQKIDKNQAS